MHRLCLLLGLAFLGAGCASGGGREIRTTDSPGPAASVRLPETIDFVLENGLRIHLLPNHEVPLVYFGARIDGGGLTDPAGKEGACALMARLLERGAGGRDANAFQEAVDFVGGTFSTTAGWRWVDVEAEFLSADAPLALELLADALRRPRLDADEFEKARGLASDAISAARDQPNELLPTYWNAWLFAGHPYARPPGGDETTLSRLTLDDIRQSAATALSPRRTRLVVAGAFDPQVIRGLIAERLGDWAAASPAPVSIDAGRDAGLVSVAPGSRVLLVDKPDALQTYFRFGHMGSDWSHPDYAARYVANTILGGRFTSRLNTALRIDSGLSYGAGSGFDDALQGAFAVRTYTATATSREALELARDVYLRFVEDGLTQAELESAVTYIQGQYAPDQLETSAQAAGMLLDLSSDGLSRDVVDGFFGRLDALTLDEVNRVIREHFPSQSLLWVVIGQAEHLRPIVGQFGDVTEIQLTDPGFGPGFSGR
jgi:predicted Zn-dependent peptidase